MRPGSSTLRSGLLGVFACPSRVDNLELEHMPAVERSILSDQSRQAGSGQRSNTLASLQGDPLAARVASHWLTDGMGA